MDNMFLCIDIFISIVGIVFGISGCITFFVFHNIVAGTWAFFSALFASICFHLHYLKLKSRIEDFHSPIALQKLADLGIVVAAIAFSFSVWYLFAVIYWHLPVMPVSGSYVIILVWSFMTAKWGGLLWYTSKKYARNLNHDYTSLISNA